MSEPSVLSSRMFLAWVVACSRCHDEQVVEEPDDKARAEAVFVETGWTSTLAPNRNKTLLAEHLDTSYWPDEVSLVLCPSCSGECVL